MPVISAEPVLRSLQGHVRSIGAAHIVSSALVIIAVAGCAPAAFPMVCEVPATAAAPLEAHGSPEP
ncbi:MAG: hypothetical protein U5K81_11910 [Trueperaceae bacterium]|nr:hypothetical protein [Trueperaceae bacterium]